MIGSGIFLGGVVVVTGVGASFGVGSVVRMTDGVQGITCCRKFAMVLIALRMHGVGRRGVVWSASISSTFVNFHF